MPEIGHISVGSVELHVALVKEYFFFILPDIPAVAVLIMNLRLADHGNE
jgi:hypothetical protein